MSTQTQTFGTHLILDCYGADPKKLQDVGLIFRFLDELPALIGMQKIGPPQMANFDDEAIAGVTGVIQIVTSHISIHTYALKHCFFMDVFSCSEFDPQTVIDHVKKAFSVDTIEHTVVSRGKHFPVNNLSQPEQKQ